MARHDDGCRQASRHLRPLLEFDLSGTANTSGNHTLSFGGDETLKKATRNSLRDANPERIMEKMEKEERVGRKKREGREKNKKQTKAKANHWGKPKLRTNLSISSIA